MNGLKTFAAMVLCAMLAGPGLPAAETIRINGSGSALELVRTLVAAYRQANPAVMVDLERPLGSSGSMKALLAGVLDLAAISRAPQPAEVAQGVRFREYGRTPLAIVTGPNVPRTAITADELADLYAWKVRFWADGEPVRIVLRPEGDIDSEILQGLSPRMASAWREAKSRPGMIVAITDTDADEILAKTPGGIGTAAWCGLLADNLTLNVLALNGVKPSLRSIADGTYPLVRGIRFATTARSAPGTFKLLEFFYSPKGRAIARQNGVLVD